METISLYEFKKLKWVQDAETDGTGYKIKTKKKTLKTVLTHRIMDCGNGYGASYDNRYTQGLALDTPVPLILPQYWIHLRERGFDFTFAKDPGEKAHEQIGFTPTYQGIYSRDAWQIPMGVCYGDSDRNTYGVSTIDEYQSSEGWKERLIIAAVYLQSAEPHYGQTWYRTAYARRLGLIGDEYVHIDPAIETRRAQAEEERERVAELVRAQEQVTAYTQNMATQQQDTTTGPVPRFWGLVRGNGN